MLRNPFYSVLALVVHLIALAILFLLLRAEFLAAAQVVVYAGAVMVLYVFVVAYVGGSTRRCGPRAGRSSQRSGRCSRGALFVELDDRGGGLVGWARSTRAGADVGAGFGSPGAIGELLLTKFLLAFEAASFLLLVAAVGAVVLARRRAGCEEAPRP